MRLFKPVQTFITSILLILLGGFGGYYVGTQGYVDRTPPAPRNVKIINKESQIVDFSRFWEVWDLLNKEHINRPFDAELLLDGAVHGMVESIKDPYTTYLNKDQNKTVVNALNGKYQGIGAQLGYDDQERLIIVAPLDGSPAQSAGVRAGDRILKIEGEDTVGTSIEEAVNKIRGDAGTTSTLTLGRDGVESPFEVKIVRDVITLASVKWEDKRDGIAYIRLSRFGAETNEEWSNVVSEVVTQMPNLKGVILDMRNNPGGYLDSAVYVSSEFINKGVVVREYFSDGRKQDYRVERKGLLTNKKVKVIVLIDGGSASASEIVAGALKERRDAVLVGVRSFGKGTVQKADDFADGASLHVTVAKWLTPDDNWVDKHNSKFKDSSYNEVDKDGKEIIGGLKPDYEVVLSDEDVKSENDAQLNKAVELLKSGKPLKGENEGIITNLMKGLNLVD